MIYQKLHNFCVVDLGGFYLDVHQGPPVHDAAPTACRAARRRRAMYWIAEAMVRWLAPILSFTAEEIWRFMPGERAESVFFTDLGRAPRDRTVARRPIDWPKVLEARAAVLRELERLRVAEQIGAPLDAEVTLYGTPAWTAALQPLGDELRFVLITSEAHVADAGSRPAEARGDGWRGQERALAARQALRGDRNACVAGTSGRTSVPWPRTRNCAAVVRSISTARARPAATPEASMTR